MYFDKLEEKMKTFLQAAPLSTAALPASTQEDMQGLTVEEAAPLGSLEKVADYPLYTMRYDEDSF